MRRARFRRSSTSAAAASGGQSPAPRDRNKNKAIRDSEKLLTENVVVIVSTSKCFMSISMKSLLETLGVNPIDLKVDAAEEGVVLVELSKIDGVGPRELPALYIGGKLLGGIDKVIETHIKGELVPMLRAAGALCL